MSKFGDSSQQVQEGKEKLFTIFDQMSNKPIEMAKSIDVRMNKFSDVSEDKNKRNHSSKNLSAPERNDF